MVCSANIIERYKIEYCMKLQRQAEMTCPFLCIDIKRVTKRKTFKSTYQIIQEISKVWDDLNDIDRTAVLELMAGKLLPEYVVIHI